MAQRENLFKRLTRLFRSGPVVRSKIKHASITAEKPASSMLDHLRAPNNMYANAVASYGQYDRLSRYADFSEMEYTPEIAAGLDIYADEACSANEHGNILHVYSNNQKIKETLEQLFFDVLNVEFNLYSWVRNLCKYGDFFLFNDVHTEYGLTNVFPIPVNEIEREEGYDPKDPFAVRFRWVTQGNQVLENWQVTHFRMLGNDNFLPYGSSVIEPCRRIWRQLTLIEDAMMVYRIVRSPERRIFYIDVANIPQDDITTYMERAKTSLKRNQVTDTQTGRVDLRYNPLSVDEDYFIPTRGEQSTKIETLAGGQFTGDIEDVEYIQKKLFAALKIPRAYLGYDEDLSGKATLAQEDIRFSRTTTRIQKIIISELNKMAIIHLYCHGFTGDDIIDFNLSLNNPSTIAQQQKLELWRSRFEIATGSPEGMFSRRWLQDNLFMLTEEEVETIKKQKIRERVEDAELEKKIEELTAGEEKPETEPEGESPITGMLGGEGEGPGEGHDDANNNTDGEIGQTWDIVIPSLKDTEGIDQISTNVSKVRAKGRERRGRPHRSLAYGPGATEMPDMKNIANPRKQLEPYDKDFFKSFTKFSYLSEDKLEKNSFDDYFIKKVSEIAKVDSQIRSTLKKLDKIIPKSKILTEQENEDK